MLGWGKRGEYCSLFPPFCLARFWWLIRWWLGFLFPVYLFFYSLALKNCLSDDQTPIVRSQVGIQPGPKSLCNTYISLKASEKGWSGEVMPVCRQRGYTASPPWCRTGQEDGIMWVSTERGQSASSSLYPCEKSWILGWLVLPCHLADDRLHLLIPAVAQLHRERFIQIKL